MRSCWPLSSQGSVCLKLAESGRTASGKAERESGQSAPYRADVCFRPGADIWLSHPNWLLTRARPRQLHTQRQSYRAVAPAPTGACRQLAHEWRAQYRSHLKAVPLSTIRHERSPRVGETHQAAVRFPPAEPSEVQVRVGPCTGTCPVPSASPTLVELELTSCTRNALAACAEASGHGWFGLHVPSISRAAIPARRIRGPSSHQIGPSPS